MPGSNTKRKAEKSPTPDPEGHRGEQHCVAPTNVPNLNIRRDVEDEDTPEEAYFQIRPIPQRGSTFLDLLQLIEKLFKLEEEGQEISGVARIDSEGEQQPVGDEGEWREILAAYHEGRVCEDLNLLFTTTAIPSEIPPQPPISTSMPPHSALKELKTRDTVKLASGLPVDDAEFLRLFHIGDDQDGINPPGPKEVANKAYGVICDRTNVTKRLGTTLNRAYYDGAWDAFRKLKSIKYPDGDRGNGFNSQRTVKFLQQNHIDENGTKRSAAEMEALALEGMASPGREVLELEPSAASHSITAGLEEVAESSPAPRRGLRLRTATKRLCEEQEHPEPMVEPGSSDADGAGDDEEEEEDDEEGAGLNLTTRRSSTTKPPSALMRRKLRELDATNATPQRREEVLGLIEFEQRALHNTFDSLGRKKGGSALESARKASSREYAARSVPSTLTSATSHGGFHFETPLRGDEAPAEAIAGEEEADELSEDREGRDR